MHPTALTGRVLDGKYRMLGTIGAGGVGTVYEAENVLLRRRVAVKVVTKRELGEASERLAREAQMIASLRHPNICDVYDVGRLPEGGPYVVLERLVGETFAARARRAGAPLPIPEVIDVALQVLSALHAAHSAKIIHRDVKPQNIFLAERIGCPPIVKLVDFGFAQDLGSRKAARLTRPGHACGTRQYMAPEQLTLGHVDHRADLFALGVVMYQALAGRHPFAGGSEADLKRNILRHEPCALRFYRRDLPEPVEAIIHWTLQKDATLRPASAQELQRALADASCSLSMRRRSEPSSIDVIFDDDASPTLTQPLWNHSFVSSAPSSN